MIHIRGPSSGNAPVSHRKVHSIQNGQRKTAFLVTIHLRQKHSPQSPPNQPQNQPQLPNTESLADSNKESPAEVSDLDSEIEVVEVRKVDGFDRDLHALDGELNRALQRRGSGAEGRREPGVPALGSTAGSTLGNALGNAPGNHKPINRLFMPLAPPKPRDLPPPPGYRNIPPNLVSAIQRELNVFMDNSGQDDLEVVGKVISSLKDPYSATKIRLPVKATTCRHFECFDLYNFCLFHKLPAGVRATLRKSLIIKNNDSRKLEQLFYMQQRKIAEGSLLFKDPGLVYPLFSEHGQMFFSEVYSRTPPLYKCPLCDEKFGLRQLYISDIFNFFVKTTPKLITKIELVEADRYKIIDDEGGDSEEPEVLLVGDSEEETEPGPLGPSESLGPSEVHPRIKPEASPEPLKAATEDFNDGLDDVLISISQGDGSWQNPVVFD